MKYKNIHELKECPYCGHKEYFIKESFKGNNEVYMTFKGEVVESVNTYENANHKRISKFAFCANCEKRIARLDHE